MTFAFFGGTVSAEERYVLEAQQHSPNGRQSTAIYYDRREQRLVKKTFQWSREFERRRLNAGRPQFEFPAQSANLSNVAPKTLESHNVKVSYEHHSLYYPGNRNKTANAIRSVMGSSTAANNLVRKLEAKANSGSSQFDLVATGRNGNGRRAKDFAVYFNRERGIFVTKTVKRKRSDSPPFNFPRKMGRPSLLNPPSSDRHFKMEDSDAYYAKTPEQFASALSRMKSDFRNAGIRYDKGLFDWPYRSMQDLRKGDVLIKERYSGNKLYKVYYNFDRHELYTQEMELDSRDRSKVKKITGHLFDLTTDYGYQGARNLLVRSRVYKEDDLDRFRGVRVKPCRDVIESHVLPDLTDFENITDALWDRHLTKAVGDQAIIGDNRSMFLELNILDKPRRVKVFLDARGQIARAEWVGMTAEEAEKEGLKLEFKTDDDGQRNYMISTNYPDGDWKPAMGIAGDNVRIEKGVVKGNLAVYVKGKKSGEFEYEDFEKSVFPFEFGKDRRDIASVGKRTRLDGSAKNHYDIDTPHVDGSGGLKNGFFKLFFSKDGRREFVRDTIYENANETLGSPEYNHLLTNREIWNISNDISYQLGRRTQNYTSSVTDIEAKAAEMAYAAFGDEILIRVIKEMLPAEDPKAISSVVMKVTEAFKECLARAEKNRNKAAADQCMEIFKTEAPVYVGKEILFLKMKQNELGDYESIANDAYMACVKEHYRPNATDPDSTNKIKGCLYQAFLITVDKSIDPVLDKEIEKMGKDKGYNLKLTSEEKSSILGSGRSCLKTQGLQSDGLFGTKFNMSKLENLEPADFERKLMTCVDNIKVDTGRVVVRSILKVELQKQDLTPNEKHEASEWALSSGYEACVGVQRKVIEELEGPKSNDPVVIVPGRPQPKTEQIAPIPGMDPGECANLVMNRTLSKVVPLMVSKAIGPAFYKELLAKSETPPAFLVCFDREEKRLLDEIPNVLRNDVGLSKEEKVAKSKARADKTDRKHANCLKEALSWASHHAVGNIVEETLAADPELAKVIKIDAEAKKVLGTKIQACFEKELEQYTSVNQMTEVLDPLKEKCGVQMLQDSEVQGILFAPVVLKSLKDSGVKDDKLEQLNKDILAGMNEEIKSAKTIDEAIAKAKAYKGKAAIQVIDVVLVDKISEMVNLKDPKAKDAEVQRLVDLTKKELLSKDGQNFKLKLEQAAASGDDAKMDAVIEQFKLESTKLIGPEIVELTGQELLKDGLLSNQNEINVMRSRGEAILKQCLDKKAENVEMDKHIDECVVKLKSSTTQWVIQTALIKNLTEEENSRIFSVEDRQRIINKILDDKAKAEIERISRIKDKAEGDKALKQFTIKIKSAAAEEFVQGIIPYTLDKVLTVSKRASDQMRDQTLAFKGKLKDELIGEFDKCIDKYRIDANAALDGNWSNEKYNPDEEFDACANKLRLSSMERIMPFKFKEILRLLSKDETKNDGVIKRSELFLSQCVRDVDIYLDPKEYKYKMDACAAMTVFSFTKDSIQYARDLGDGLFVQNPKTMEEWDACVLKMREDVIQKLDRYNDDKSLGDIEDHLQFISEAFRLNANVKDEEYEPVTMDWIADRIKKCGLESLVPNLIQEYKQKVITDPALKLTAKEQAVTGAFLDTMSRILETKYDGKPVNFQIDQFVKDLNEELDKMSPSEKESTPDYITLMEEFQPLIYGYVKDLVNYDQKGFVEAIKDFEERVKRAIRLNKGKLSIPELKDILVDSKLGKILLKSLVSKIIKDKAGQALKDQGVDPGGVVWQLSSKTMIDRIFNKKDGKATMTYIQRKLKDLDLREIFELLDTKREGSKEKLDTLMKDINGKVIDTLANDTHNGGFVETLFGPIAQKGLTEQRDWIESGFTAIFKVPAAGWMGYNRNEFHWGTRYDNRSYSLRNTPSGKKAVTNFADHILKPLMKDGMSESEIEKRVEKYVKPKIEDALGENGVGLWE